MVEDVAYALYPPRVEDLPTGIGLEMGSRLAPIDERARRPDDYSELLETICGTTDDSQNVEQYDGTLGVTIDFVNARQRPAGQVQWNANLAGIYTNPGNVSGVRWGSGTLIARDLFLTAGHLFDRSAGGWDLPRQNGTTDVISSQEIATNMRVNFDFQFDAAGNLRTEQSFAITELVEFRLGGLDFAIIRLMGNPADTFGTSGISSNDAAVGEMICIIGHPAGEPKRIEAGPTTAVSGTTIRYNDIDTLGGNSGSGMLRANDGLIVGVHTNGGCTTTGGSNSGVRITSIVDASPTVAGILATMPTGPPAQGDDMQPGEVLTPGGSITSANGTYTFVYQGDGNLVLYRSGGVPLWASATDGTTPGVCIMQGDGNLVVYRPGPQPVWDSGTWGQPGNHLVVQDDGNVVIYHPDGSPAWATNTVQ